MSDRDNHPTLDVEMLNDFIDNGGLSVWNSETDVHIREVRLSEEQNDDGPLKYTLVGYRFKANGVAEVDDKVQMTYIEERVEDEVTIYTFRDKYTMYQRLEPNF